MITEQVRRQALAALAATPMGRVEELLGLHLRVTGLTAAVGDLVAVETAGTPLLAEVAASDRAGLVCLPLGATTGLRVGDPVRSTGGPLRVGVGEALCGRVLDGLGRPLDDGPSLADLPQVAVTHAPPGALSRPRIDHQLGLGVRSLDALTPCGRGQRIGIMAGSGVGKSSLLSMVARGTDAEISVIALIGERGREVREFLDNDLGPEGLARSVVVVATSDAPPVERLRAASVATRIAEWFRDSGRHVVLMMDSLTRVAMAQREVGLSAGEPPATRGYPPSVFALLPQLLERAGTSPDGSITGLYTVLVEGDDLQDPIGDTARSILDGHVVLSRRLATAGHFPSVDVLESISRVTSAVTTPDQRADATRLRRMLAAHRSVRELVEIGAYVSGADPDADAAIARMPAIDDFLRQSMDEVTPTSVTWARLRELVGVSAIHDRGLRAVARVRGVREQDSRLGWQRAVTEQEQAAATTARLEERLAATPRVDGSTGMFLAHQAGMAALAADVAAARAAEASAARLSESARQHWQRDAVRLAAVEQLLEQRAVRRRAERARQETAAVEDVVTARWTHARRLASGTGGAS